MKWEDAKYSQIMSILKNLPMSQCLNGTALYMAVMAATLEVHHDLITKASDHRTFNESEVILFMSALNPVGKSCACN